MRLQHFFANDNMRDFNPGVEIYELLMRGQFNVAYNLINESAEKFKNPL